MASHRVMHCEGKSRITGCVLMIVPVVCQLTNTLQCRRYPLILRSINFCDRTRCSILLDCLSQPVDRGKLSTLIRCPAHAALKPPGSLQSSSPDCGRHVSVLINVLLCDRQEAVAPLPSRISLCPMPRFLADRT